MQSNGFQYIHNVVLYNHHHCLIPEYFHHNKKKPHASQLSPPSIPWQSLIYSLSLCIFLFWAVPMNGIIWYGAFCDWLLSLSKTLSRFIHVVAGIPFYGWLVIMELRKNSKRAWAVFIGQLGISDDIWKMSRSNNLGSDIISHNLRMSFW